ncbi:zinc finger and SCAN domain-containing protein 10 [Drosophila serrata]|uniref:zinc finger and SCAN domain-containing protein 10 n=1 Tax=Drosophila serrata TaxID=7274 RepID=UPI000A1D2244|nr:zinc finger and SCAN domain-containing protein 10 [Drosophila serrata]
MTTPAHSVVSVASADSGRCSQGKDKDSPRLMCEYCGHRTRLLWNLHIHLRRHTGELPFSCQTCQARFAARYQLTTHLERHTDAAERRRRHFCTACNVGFSSYRALYHHRPLHEDEKRYKCQQCDKQFAQAAGYAQHKRWHRQRIQRATERAMELTANTTNLVAGSHNPHMPCLD